MRDTEAGAVTLRTASAVGANKRGPASRSAISAFRFAATRAFSSSSVTRDARSTRYTPRSGDTVSPSRSATIKTRRPSGDGTHTYSGAIVRTVLLWNRRVRVDAGSRVGDKS